MFVVNLCLASRKEFFAESIEVLTLFRAEIFLTMLFIDSSRHFGFGFFSFSTSNSYDCRSVTF